MKIEKFEDLIAWQEARKLVNPVREPRSLTVCVSPVRKFVSNGADGGFL